MPENLDLVRSIYADWERGDFSSTEWADSEIECVNVDGPEPGSWTGLSGMAKGVRDFLSAWEGYRSEPSEYRELDDERVLVFTRAGGRGKASGLDLAQMRAEWIDLLHIRDGKVAVYRSFRTERKALEAAGVAE